MSQPQNLLSALILAGGHSQRMGRDKTQLTLEGQTLLERAVQRIAPVAAEVIISLSESADPQKGSALAGVPVRYVADRVKGAGPLGGLEAGLGAANSELVVMLAADMPFIDCAVVRFLASLAPGFDVVIPIIAPQAPRLSGREPLHAIYRRSCLPSVEARLRSGHRQMVSFFPDVRVREVSAAEIATLDPEFRSFVNVNTPEDLDQARILAGILADRPGGCEASRAASQDNTARDEHDCVENQPKAL